MASARWERTDRRTRGPADEAAGEPRGRARDGPAPAGAPGRARGSCRGSSRAGGAAARGAASPAEVCREAGKRRRLLPSLPIGEGGGSGGSAADTGREGGEAKERKGGGEKGRPEEPPAAPAAAAPAPAGRWRPALRAPCRGGPAAQSGAPTSPSRSPPKPTGRGTQSSPVPRAQRLVGGAQGGRRGGGGVGAAAARPAGLLTCARPAGTRESGAPRPRETRGAQWVLLGRRPRLLGASVNLKEDIKSSSSQGLGVLPIGKSSWGRMGGGGAGKVSRDFFLTKWLPPPPTGKALAETCQIGVFPPRHVSGIGVGSLEP